MPISSQLCEPYGEASIWQTCACPECKPCLHKKDVHSADVQPYNFLGGLKWRGHDAWRIASLAVSSFTGPLRPQESNHSLTRWTEIYRSHHLRRAAADRLDEAALNETVEIMSDVFFLGQLPSSKIRVRWCCLKKNQLGCLQSRRSRREPMILQLNCNHVALRYCAKRILCVVLHEMAHAFFDYYACYPAENKPGCAKGTCGKLYQLNIGLTGHGRAWQYLIHNIQQAMPQLLGFKGDLGRRAGMYNELHAGGKYLCTFASNL